MTGDGPKMVHFGPKMAKHGRLVNTPKWSKRVQKGPKWSIKVLLTIWDPFSAHMGPFGPFQTKMIFLPEMDKVGFGIGAPDKISILPACYIWNVIVS